MNLQFRLPLLFLPVIFSTCDVAAQKIIFAGLKPSLVSFSVETEPLIIISEREEEAKVPKSWMKQTIIVRSDPPIAPIKPADWKDGSVTLTFSDSLPNPLTLSVFEVKATRLDVPSSLLPSHISRINSPAIMNPVNMAELFERSGELFVQRSQLGGGSPVIRGFEANKVLLVVDGVRMNNLIFRGGHLQNALRLDPNATESVEILSGPGSQVYGSDALGGVISIKTACPSLSSTSKMEAKGGAMYRMSSGNLIYFNQETAANCWFNLGWKRLAVRTSISFSKYGDQRQGATGGSDLWLAKEFVKSYAGKDSVLKNTDPLLQKRSAYSQLDFNQKWLISGKKNDSPLHTLNLQYSLSSDVNRYDRLSERDNDQRPVYSEWYYGPESRIFGSYQLTFRRHNPLFQDGKIIAAYQQFKESRNTRRFGQDGLTARSELVDMYTLNGDWTIGLGENLQVYYGFEGFYNSLKSTASKKNVNDNMEAPASTRYPAGGSNVFSIAAYITAQLSLGKNVVITAGERYTSSRLNADFGVQTFYPFPFSTTTQKNSDFCSQVGAVLQTNKKHLRVRTQWAQGFRSPNADDLTKVFDSQPGTLVIPNPSLRSERTQTYEAGIEYSYSSWLFVQLTAFKTKLYDAIVIDRAKLNGADSVIYEGVQSEVRSSVNRSEAAISGLSFNIKWRFLPRFELSGSANYTKGTQVSGDTMLPLDHIPPLYGRAGLSWQYKSWDIEGWTIFNAGKPLNDYYLNGEDNIQYATPDGTPSWQTFNVSVKKQFMKKLNVQLSCENIADIRYRTFSSGISAPGRLIRLSLRFAF